MKSKPLYKQLTQMLITHIRNDLSINDLLPSERKLSEVTKYSRTTVRLAMQELEKLGYTKIVHGKGHVVINTNPSRYDLGSMYSFSDHMAMIGNKATTKILRLENIDSSEMIQFIPNSPDKLVLLNRLRLANDEPMLLEFTYLPDNIFPNLVEYFDESKGLYATFLNRYDIHIQKAIDEVHATVADEFIAKHLRVNVGDSIIEIHRETFDVDKRKIEHTISYARSDNFSYRIVHNR